MHLPRALLTVVPALLLSPALLFAQAAAPAAAEPAKDPVDAAIQTLWTASKAEGYISASLTADLDKARKLLVEQREKSFPRIVALLDNNEPEIRLHGAIVLAAIAQDRGNSAELLKALQRCLNDSNAAVAYWGAQGIMVGPALPEAEKVSALSQCLKPARPRPLRVSAALAAGDAKLTAAIPVLIRYLDSIKEDCSKQIKITLTPQSGGTDAGKGAAGMPGEGAPGFAAVGKAGAYGPGGGYAVTGARPTGAAGGVSHGAPVAPGAGPVPGAAVVAPGAATGSQPEGAAIRREPPPPIDPAKLTQQEQEVVIRQLEALPTVQELHHIGMVLDALAKGSAHKTTFGFDSTPPWALADCVNKATTWLAANEASFASPAPAPAKAPEAAPAPAPVAPAAPAPAAPAPAPAAGGK